MPRTFLLTFIFSFSAVQGNTQQLSLTVVANGLHLRKGPSAASPSLAILPFGTVVTAAVDRITMAMAADTGALQLEPVVAVQQEWKRDVMVTDTSWLTGQWWPVQYDSLSGYAFSAFLYDGPVAPAGPDSIELLMEIGDQKLLFPPGWHWYGLYDYRGDARFSKIEVFWTIEWSAAEMKGYPRLVTNQQRRALFVLACADTLPLGRYRGDWGNPMGGFEPLLIKGDTALRINRRVLRNTRLLVSLTPDGQAIAKVFSQTRSGKQQQLLPLESATDFPAENVFVAWYGDFDGDGRRDFILGVPDFEEHYTRFYLFASKEAKRGRHLKWLSACGLYDGMDLD